MQLELSWTNWKVIKSKANCRGVFRDQSNIYDGAFLRLKAVSYSRKKATS